MPEMVSIAGETDLLGRLRDLIIRGRLAPGAPLVEADVAVKLGVSRTPVREALQQLRREGLVAVSGGGERPRLAVAPLKLEAISELYRAVGALEGVAAREVVRLPESARLTLAREMRSCDKAFRREARSRKPDLDVLFERHDAFHHALRRESAGTHTLAVFDVLRPQVDRYEWFFAPLTGPDFSATYAEHAAIVEAVGSGSAKQVERAVRANWFNGGNRLAEAFAVDTRHLDAYREIR